MRVLVVEDDAAMRVMFEAVLGDEDLDLAPDGMSGLEVLERHGPFDVVLLDIMLPDLDGVSVLRRIRRSVQPDVPVLMLSALADEPHHVAAYDAGADGYMTKPFDSDVLIDTLRDVISRTPTERHQVRTAERDRAVLLAQVERLFSD